MLSGGEIAHDYDAKWLGAGLVPRRSGAGSIQVEPAVTQVVVQLEGKLTKGA